MEEMRDALLRLVRAWTRAHTVLEAYVKVNMDSNMLFQTCAEIEESITFLLGEADKDLEDTVTHIALTAPYLEEDRRVSIMMSKYTANHPAMPAPILFERKDMRKSVKENGGYMRESLEGGWS